MDVAYRLARVEDAAASADCHRTCWQEAYAEVADPERLRAATEDAEAWVERTRRILTDGGPRWLAWYGDQVVGFATAGESRDDDADPADATYELYAIYLREAWHGSGVAQELFDRAVPPGIRCSLWVLEANPRAQAFYARNGFEADGTREYYEGLGVWEIRMVRPASA